MKRTLCPQCRRRLGPGERIHPACVSLWADTRAAKAERAQAKAIKTAAKEDRAETKRRREEMKSLRDLLAEAQTEFNRFIRLRDADLPCICCGSVFEPMKPGGSMDAGHFRSRSTAPQIRFNEDNVFGQRKNCNRPGGTTYAKFRAGAIERIGLERVEAVEADNTAKKWDKDEVREIRETYKAKAKAMEKERF